MRRAAYSVAANIVEGTLRESKKGYLHFLYIASGSLAETQYLVHLARRLDYLSPEEAEALERQTKLTFACLYGLIRAVENEAGKLSKFIATSLIAIALIRWSGSQLSVVS
jgi:four helix bundle protein